MPVLASYVADDFLVIAVSSPAPPGISPGAGPAGSSAAKLYQTEVGWGAGSGFKDLINDFFINLTQCSINNSRDIRQCYFHTYLRACQEHPGFINAINKTKVVFSFLAKGDDRSSLRVGILGKDFFEESTGVLSKGNLLVIWPENIEQGIIEEIEKKYHILAGGLKEINDIIFIISRLFQDVAGILGTAADTCDFGVTVLMGGGLTSFNIKDSAGSIEQACLTGTLDKKINFS